MQKAKKAKNHKKGENQEKKPKPQKALKILQLFVVLAFFLGSKAKEKSQKPRKKATNLDLKKAPKMLRLF